MKHFKRPVTIILLALAVIAFFVLVFQRREVIGKQYLIIKETAVIVEVADTNASRGKGLGDRDSLSENNGMLFVFDDSKRWDFWMGGMRFGLDFIWIENNTIVDITENVPPPTETGTAVFVKPKTEVRYVLEVNKGWVKKHNIEIGDRVEFHL